MFFLLLVLYTGIDETKIYISFFTVKYSIVTLFIKERSRDEYNCYIIIDVTSRLAHVFNESPVGLEFAR